MRRWLFLICCLVWVACTVKAKDATSATPQQLPPDIDSLELRISQDLAALGLSENPPDSMSVPLDPSSDTTTQPVQITPNRTEAGNTAFDSTKSKERLFFKNRDAKAEKKSEPNQCQRTCDLVDNICAASERICEITSKMPSDPDAPKRCERAKSSCERAKQQGQTCGCSS
jgi:hypothetical protein